MRFGSKKDDPQPFSLLSFFTCSAMAAVIELDSKKDSEEYPGHATIYVIVTSVLAAMGGLIFGYDIGITGNYFMN